MSTPFMNLTLPTPSVTPGPTFATENNNAFLTIDAHDHGPGSGTPVRSNGLNIDADLSIQNHALTALSLLSFTVGAGTSTRSALYFQGVDLYANDASGNVIQITAGGTLNVAAATRGFGGDYGVVGTGAATYSNTTKTFTFTQASNQSALMDVGELLVRRTTVASQPAGHILSPTLSSDSYLTLPGSGIHIQLPTALPASTGIVTLDSSGNMAAGATVSATGGKAFVVVDGSGVPSAVPASAPSAQAMVTINNAGAISNIQPDGSTLEIASATTLRVKDLGITNAKIANATIVGAGTGTTKFVAGTIGTADLADGCVTQAKRAALLQSIVSVTSTTIIPADGNKNLTPTPATITSTGRPIVVALIPDGTGDSYVSSNTTFAGTQVTSGGWVRFSADAGSSFFASMEFTTQEPQGTNESHWAPGMFSTVWVPGAGSKSVTAFFTCRDGNTNLKTVKLKLAVYEL